MKAEIRLGEIQLFDFIQVVEEFVSGFVAVMLGSCVYMFCGFWGEGRQRKIVLIVGGFGPSKCQCCMCKFSVYYKCYTEKFFFLLGVSYLTSF